MEGTSPPVNGNLKGKTGLAIKIAPLIDIDPQIPCVMELLSVRGSDSFIPSNPELFTNKVFRKCSFY
jgi:hypothetical protein